MLFQRIALHTLTIEFIVLALTGMAAARPNFDMVGFATQNGGTTGGKGGKTVAVTSFSQLKNSAESSERLVIKVSGKITKESGGGAISIKSNKSVIGEGGSAFLEGVGFHINSNNIIIRNLKMTLVGAGNAHRVNGGDVISILGSAKNIWIDHCELYSEDPDVQKDIDKYDGLIDVKGKTGFITFSWNYFHDHHKCGIVGASESDIYSDRKITFHHNYYYKVRLRVPHYRGGTGHFFNNYIVGAKDASEIRNGACVRVERNYYEPLHYSIYTPNDYKGRAERIENIEIERYPRPYPPDCVADIPYDYDAVLTRNTEEVKTIVPLYAGVGKLGSVVNRIPDEGHPDHRGFTGSAGPHYWYSGMQKTLNVRTSTGNKYKIQLFGLNGKLAYADSFTAHRDVIVALPLNGLAGGIYIVRLSLGSQMITGRLTLL